MHQEQTIATASFTIRPQITFITQAFITQAFITQAFINRYILQAVKTTMVAIIHFHILSLND
jgi:hypothetical protein